MALVVYRRLTKINTPVIKGTEKLNDLSACNVLFVSNHQTYFADGIFMFNVFNSALNNSYAQIKFWNILKVKIVNLFFIAAQETMSAGIVPKFLSLAGAIPVKRTWREAGKEIKRGVEKKDTENIEKALKTGWVITFPQGTTTAYAVGRKGTAHIIKNYKPVVVPVVIDGLRQAFGKKGNQIIKRGVDLKLTVKEPLKLDYNDTVENILETVMDAIEQSEKFRQSVKPEKLKS
ncbi:MAG: lysophospholipid acyltransferase family protein [Vicingaceae bacterium]